MRKCRYIIVRLGAILTVSATLSACQLPHEPSSKSRTAVSSEHKVEAKTSSAKHQSSQGTSIKDKTTRTIETPWGPKEIYDPVKDPEFIKLFQDYRDTYDNGPYPECFKAGVGGPYTGPDCLGNFYTVFKRQGLRRIVDLDLARVGCAQVIDNSCVGGSVGFFAKNCGTNHNFGSAELSQCEAHNYRILLPRVQPLITACELNGQRYDAYSYKTEPDIEKAMQDFAEIQCYRWTPGWEESSP